MSQTTTEQANAAKKKPYHSPQLRKFGNVNELTTTNAGTPPTPRDSNPSMYVS